MLHLFCRIVLWCVVLCRGVMCCVVTQIGLVVSGVLLCCAAIMSELVDVIRLCK